MQYAWQVFLDTDSSCEMNPHKAFNLSLDIFFLMDIACTFNTAVLDEYGYVLPYTLHPTPHTLHSAPYTLLPPPYTLHPTPYTPHPTPYTLNIFFLVDIACTFNTAVLDEYGYVLPSSLIYYSQA